MSPLLLQITDEASDVWLWWLLLTLGAFLLGSILTWLFTRGDSTKTIEVMAERDRYHKGATKWEKDYQGVKYQLDEAHKMEADLRANLQSCEADCQMLRYRAEKAEANLAAGTAIIPSKDKGPEQTTTGERLAVVMPDERDPGGLHAGSFEADNLLLISGISPEISDLLNSAGIRSWHDLAASDPNELRRILHTAGGGRYRHVDPSAWPAQASLAASGDLEGLRDLQARLKKDS